MRIHGGPDAPGEARAALRRYFPELGPDLMQVAILLISELVSNAVRHASAPMIAVDFGVTSAALRVEVGDEGPGFREGPRPHPEPGKSGGWGLYLVDELASRWGIMDPPGARVWFELDR